MMQATPVAATPAVAQGPVTSGTTVPPQQPPLPSPAEAVLIFGALALVLLLPLSIALARRVWRRSAPDAQISYDSSNRLAALERGMEAISLEVERIGEGQRYLTRMLTEREVVRELASGSPEPDSAGSRARIDEPM